MLHDAAVVRSDGNGELFEKFGKLLNFQGAREEYLSSSLKLIPDIGTSLSKLPKKAPSLLQLAGWL